MFFNFIKVIYSRVIASLSSQLFYDGRLVCANDKVEEATIKHLCNIVDSNPGFLYLFIN